MAGCSGTRQLIAEPAETITKAGMSTRAKNWEHNALVYTECHDTDTALQGGVSPFHHKIWECSEDIPSMYIEPLQSWLRNSPATYVFLWTRKVREAFVLRILGRRKLMLYRRLRPGAYRADLFRYIAMYFIGGYYADMDSFLLQPIKHIDHLYSATTFAMDLSPGRIHNGAILISKRGDPIFKCSMGEVFDHIHHQSYKGSDLDVSGPGVLGECLKHVTGWDDVVFVDAVDELLEEGYRVLPSIMIHNVHTVTLKSDSTGVVRNLIALGVGGKSYGETKIKECETDKHYSELWQKREIYIDDEYMD